MKTTLLFYSWLIYLFALVVTAIYFGRSGFQMNTDILSIFPDPSERQDFLAANAIYEKKYSDELLIFVEAPTKEKAKNSAEQLYHQMLGQDLFSAVQLKVEAGANWLVFLFDRRQALLTRKQLDQIESGDQSPILESALKNFYSPIAVSGSLSRDPLNLFQEHVRSLSGSSTLRMDEGYLISETDDNTRVLLRAQLNRKAPDFNQRLVDFYESTKVQAQKHDFQFFAFGPSLFAAFGSEKSIQEMGLLSAVSGLGIFLLLVWCFSSLVPIFASLLTILLSIGAGLVAVLILHPPIHVLSILLGISILGVVTDYCTHFFAKGYDESLKDNFQVIRKIRSALTMGLTTNVLTYLCFYFADLVILQQLAVFTIAGILTTYLTVIAAFPRIQFKQLDAHRFSWLLKISSLKRQRFPMRIVTCIFILTGLCTVALGGFKFDDDVRHLQEKDKSLMQDEEQVFKTLGVRYSGNYFVVRGSNQEELLQREETLEAEMSKLSIAGLGISNFVPSRQRQTLSIESYKKLAPTIQKLATEIGLQNSKKLLASVGQAVPTFTIDDFFKLAPELPIKDNLIGSINGYQYSIVQVLGSVAHSRLEVFANESVHLVNKTASLSLFLKQLRESIIGMFSWVLGLLLIMFLWVFRWKRGFLVFLLPLISAVATLVFVSLLFGSLNLFHILAVILIFCLGLDYSVFFAQAQGSTVATHIGILISFLSTVGSFGILGFSSTNAISSIGITVVIGISLCFIMSQLAVGGSGD